MGSDGGILPDAALAAVNRLHRWVIRASRGRLGWRLGRMTVLELHTVGRRSGRRYSAMLTAPIVEGDRIVLVASKGGAARHPAWYLNLAANPLVEVTTREGPKRMRARTATTEEKAELWPRIVRAYRGYAQYQQRTTREIPVVICESAD